MDFIKNLLLKVKNFEASRKNVFLVASLVVFVLSLIILLVALSSGKSGEIEQALLDGQRIEVNLETGEISGQALKSKSLDDLVEEVESAKKDEPKPEESKDKKSSGGDKPKIANAEKEKVADKKAQPENNVKKEEKPQPQDKVAQSEDPEEQEPEQVHEDIIDPHDELAWVNKDYIGPPMSDLMLDLIVGVSKTVNSEAISVKDLGDKPIIVVVLKGMGLSATTTEDAMTLPKEVTMGFSPYSPSLEQWVLKAKIKGHEVVLNVPMETDDYRLNDPGPYALLAKSSEEDNITRLKMLLSLINEEYEAIYSDRHEVFTKNIVAVTPVLKELKKQGKYFIFGGGHADFSLIQTANKLSYPILVNDIVLDDDVSSQAINDKFREIERRAKERGYIVVMARPYPITIRMMRIWLDKLEERGFMVAPVSLLLGKTFID